MSINYVSKNSEITSVLTKEFVNSSMIRIASGYFSYKVFEIFKNELQTFADKQGKFKLVIGADTNQRSIRFFQQLLDLDADEYSRELLDSIFEDFSDISSDALECAYNLFSNNVIEIKVGYSKNDGIFHVKEYLFESENHKSFINGSLNFTSNALINNYESLTYIENEEVYYDIVDNFDKRWDNCIETVNVVDLNKYIATEIKNEINQRTVSESSDDSIQLRDYQKEAIDALISSGFNGFLEMATGTGKTFTTIFGLKKYLSLSDKTHFTLIVVPYKHLASQWNKELKKVFGERTKILECHSESPWKSDFRYHVEDSYEENTFCVMVDQTLQKSLDSITSVISKSNNIFIYDEAHNLTIDNIEILEKHDKLFQSKVGLSATPYNYLNDDRTNKLFNFFKGTHFKFELSQAIDEGYLTKYDYIPHIVDLDSDEEKEYKNLVRRINLETNYVKRSNLLDEKSELLSKAKNKINKLVDVIDSLDSIKYTLVYCSPGSLKSDDGTDTKVLEQVAMDLRSKVMSHSIRMRKIVAEVSNRERDEVVKAMENENTDAILAVKCLDEGYDIPAVRQAFILHSTRNPSEFIQRRGRVLRKFQGKDRAYIYDFIVRVDGVVPDDEKIRFLEYWSLSDNRRKYNDFKNVHIGELEDE